MTIATPADLTLDARSWAMLLALSLLWGASFIFIEIAAAEIPVFTLVLARVGLAALVLHAIILASGRAYPRLPRLFLGYGLLGLLNNAIPFALIVFATPRIGAGAAAILNATTPIFTLVLAHFLTADEKINAAKLAGIGLGVLGVAVMVGPQATAGLSGEVVAALAILG